MPGKGLQMRARLQWEVRRRVSPIVRGPLLARRHRLIGPDDVALASFPRSGNHWFSMMLGELLTGEEMHLTTHPFPLPWVSGYDTSPATLPMGGKVVRTHERFGDEYARAIYLVRHPGNAALSYFRSQRLLGVPDLDQDHFLRLWARGKLNGYGTWQEHVESWLDAPIPVLTIRFEELVVDTHRLLVEAMEFMGCGVTDADIETAISHNTIDRMRMKMDAAYRVLSSQHTPAQFIGAGADWRSDAEPAHLDLLNALLRGHAARAMPRFGYEASEVRGGRSDRRNSSASDSDSGVPISKNRSVAS